MMKRKRRKHNKLLFYRTGQASVFWSFVFLWNSKCCYGTPLLECIALHWLQWSLSFHVGLIVNVKCQALILQFLIFSKWWESSCFKINITIENIYYHCQCYAIFGIVNVWIHVSFIIRPGSMGVAWLFTQSQHGQNVKGTLITHGKYK